jgi:hypothetical protein
MSAEEHYFENLLTAYARGGFELYNKISECDSNLEELNTETKETIQTCATYVIEHCDWDEKAVERMLKIKM